MRESVIVPDSSPLILLARIDQLGLLPLIPQLRPLLEALQASGIYIRQRLIDAVLQEVGE